MNQTTRLDQHLETATKTNLPPANPTHAPAAELDHDPEKEEETTEIAVTAEAKISTTHLFRDPQPQVKTTTPLDPAGIPSHLPPLPPQPAANRNDQPSHSNPSSTSRTPTLAE